MERTDKRYANINQPRESQQEDLSKKRHPPLAPPPQKPLPPVPRGRRRASSMYSSKIISLFDVVDTKEEALAPEFFLQPPAFTLSNPDLPEAPAEPLVLLEPKTYRPPLSNQHSRNFSDPTSQAFLQPTTYVARHSPKPSSDVHQGSERVSTLAKTKSIKATYPNDRDAHHDLVENFNLKETTWPTNHATHARQRRRKSREKALLALGIYPESILAGNDSPMIPNAAKGYVESRPSQSEVELPHYHDHQASAQVRKRSLSDSDSPILGDAGVLALEYHALLKDQYDSEQEDKASLHRHSADSKRSDCGLIPAPLFFGRTASHKRRASQTSSNKSGASEKEHQRSPVSLSSLFRRKKRFSAASSGSEYSPQASTFSTSPLASQPPACAFTTTECGSNTATNITPVTPPTPAVPVAVQITSKPAHLTSPRNASPSSKGSSTLSSRSHANQPEQFAKSHTSTRGSNSSNSSVPNPAFTPKSITPKTSPTTDLVPGHIISPSRPSNTSSYHARRNQSPPNRPLPPLPNTPPTRTTRPTTNTPTRSTSSPRRTPHTPTPSPNQHPHVPPPQPQHTKSSSTQTRMKPQWSSSPAPSSPFSPSRDAAAAAKRRAELKASIKLVGNVDPRDVAAARFRERDG